MLFRFRISVLFLFKELSRVFYRTKTS